MYSLFYKEWQSYPVVDINLHDRTAETWQVVFISL